MNNNTITKEIADLIGLSPEEIYEEEMFVRDEFDDDEEDNNNYEEFCSDVDFHTLED